MKKPSVVEKRFFPWPYERFVETFTDSAARLHWDPCEVIGFVLTTHCLQDLQVGESSCPLKFTLTVSCREIGEGLEVVISVSEENNSWAIMECKKKCTVLLDFLHAPLYPRLPDIKRSIASSVATSAPI